MKQKETFLSHEGDAWFDRNRQALEACDYKNNDPVVQAIKEISAQEKGRKLKILEVGCGNGGRLAWLRNELNCDVSGLEPSEKAVLEAKSLGVDAIRGTADELPFPSDAYDIVIFGFCLYLCDDSDYFRIAKEADRVLKSQAYILIYDFYSPNPRRNVYHHRPGLFSTKMDYNKFFTWHPNYVCYQHKILHHSTGQMTDEVDDWVALSLIRKSPYYDE